MVSVKKVFAASLPALALGASPASKNSDSPYNSEAVAKFPSGGSSSVEGEVSFTGQKNGSVSVHVELSGLPSTGGPLLYHIHQAPVPSNGSCAATLAHFNPNGGSTACANQTDTSYCELGDLSGKWGKIKDTTFDVTYIEPFLSLNPSNPYYFADGKRSITIHYANTTRIACANITLTNKGTSNSSNNTSSSASVSTASNFGAQVGFSGAAVVAAAAALLM